MKIIIISIVILLQGCINDIKNTIKESTTNIGKQDIRYYADKTVNNLEIPPDLTKPIQKNALNLDALVDTSENLTTFDEREIKLINKIKNKNIDIEVKKSGDRRWLVVKKDANYIWKISQNFLKDSGFRIKSSNEKIGIMETNYLENKEDVPSRNLGFIRSMFKKTFKARYALPTIDKYRIRIESINKNTTEVYLSLSSMREVVTNKGSESENTIWQEKQSDKLTENEMLYRLMIYLGSDNSVAKEKIQQATTQNKIAVINKIGINGFAKLEFKLGRKDTWDAMSWAFDELNISIEDKDFKDSSFYIYVANEEEKGIISSIFGDDAIKQNFQIKIKQLKNNLSEVYFIDLSSEKEDSTKKFSQILFDKIAKKF